MLADNTPFLADITNKKGEIYIIEIEKNKNDIKIINLRYLIIEKNPFIFYK